MAKYASIIEKPESFIIFANNPIAFKAKSYYSLGETESFHRIICLATFELSNDYVYYDGPRSFSVELSQAIEDQGEASFNLSDAAKTVIRRVHNQLDMNDAEAVFGSYRLYGEVLIKESWIRDNEEIVTGGGEDTDSHAEFYVIPGGLTDFELVQMDNFNLSDRASEGILLSRKPDGGIVYKGERFILPTLMTEDPKTQVSGEQSTVCWFKSGETTISKGRAVVKNDLDYQWIDVSLDVADGPFTFTSNLTRTLSGYYRTNTHGVHFLRFINGFGAVENISVRSKDKLSYEVSGETHSLVQGATTRPTDRRYATKSQPVGVYELSSGYVPKQWAEWFVQELLTSPRVWIQLGGKWVPALIEAEDDCVIYDRTKPEMPHVDFTLRLAIDGVTGVTW